ncbi:MAG: hypothetical protein CVU69_09070 [Deltaproteobacteria bacterium HGW-Deltaproteobacteria-4]|nr:MAG: hypothetical protein CVU69_09070 [Deltaproteobacteria bacterium HGW-Deltaproteobacteria-4]
MRFYRPSALLLLFFCLCAADCLAARGALLRLGALQQWLDLTYEYDHKDRNSSSDETGHRFEERFTLQGKYLIIGPRFWEGDFKLGLGLEQEWSEQASGRRQEEDSRFIDYRVNGIILSHKPVGGAFNASSRTVRRDQLNSPDYDLRTDRYGLSLAVRNKILPSRLDYFLTTAETDGLGRDRSTTTNQLRILTRHYQGPSRSELSVRFARVSTDFSGASEALTTRTSDLNLDNELQFGSLLRPATLDSHLFYQLEMSETEKKRLAWTENLDWRLGRALTSGVRYSLTNIERTTSGVLQDSTAHAANAFIQHRLIQSLFSRLQLTGQKLETNDGQQDDWRLGLDLSYLKKLSRQYTLTLGLGGSYGITDRQFATGLRSVSGISLVVQDVDNFLPDSAILTETIVVHSADDPGTVYLEGADYQLLVSDTLTEIIIPPGSMIATGQVLSIDYQHLLDPTIRFATRTFKSNASLNFQGNRRQLFYQFSKSWQERLSGEASSLTLSDNWTLRAGLRGQEGPHRFSLTYGILRTESNASDFIEGLWNYTQKILQGQWGVQLNDTYTWYQEVPGSHRGDYQNNSFHASTSYRQNFGNQSLSGRAFYINAQGRNSSREKLGMEVDYTVVYGKSRLSLLSGVDWRHENGRDTRSERLMLRLRRFF